MTAGVPWFKVQAALCWAVTLHAVLAATPEERRLQAPVAFEHHRSHKHTVSGFSSGADMAITHFVAFSAAVTGVGIVGGAPYGCQLLPDSGDACGAMADNTSLPWDEYVDNEFFPYLVRREIDGLIDPLENLRGSSVYLYSGQDDTCVYKDVMRAVERQLRNLTSIWGSSNVSATRFGERQAFHTVFDVPSEHAWIVDDFVCNQPNRKFDFPYFCGPKAPAEGVFESEAEAAGATVLRHANFNSSRSRDATRERSSDNDNGPEPEPDPIFVHGCCAQCDAGGQCNGRNPPVNITAPWWRPPINHCNYDMSGDMLRTVVGNGKHLPRQRRQVSRHMHLYQFKQSLYTQNGTDESANNTAMANEAFVYVPTECHHHWRKSTGVGNNTTLQDSSQLITPKCHIHVHYHCCACSYGTDRIGRSLMMQQGMIEWAEPNNIIVLYPQTTVQGVGGWGCWDWYGDAHGGGPLFDTQLGRQLRTVVNMVEDMDHIVEKVTGHVSYTELLSHAV
eukprot:INCI12385.2.p1 GENE.INCI12385.2~~INCI12385.2.p1  ORF type:complete len:505 (+),score=75.01 INCI12385.2:167-1681(+)